MNEPKVLFDTNLCGRRVEIFSWSSRCSREVLSDRAVISSGVGRLGFASRKTLPNFQVALSTSFLSGCSELPGLFTALIWDPASTGSYCSSSRSR